MGLDNLIPADATAGSAPLETTTLQDEGPEVSHKFVSFYLNDKHYAVSARAVAEVTGHLTPTALPDSPASLSGIAPHRGDILAIVDTGIVSNAAETDKRKAVVLRPLGDSVDMPVAFNVDRVGEMLQIGAREIRAINGTDPLADFEADRGTGKILIVEPSRIMSLLYS